MVATKYSGFDHIPSGSAPNTIIPGCLVLEGGGFRGIYSQGLMDAWMQAGLNLQTVVGTSAGAMGGYNYMTGQIGRSARVNLGYRHDDRYFGARALAASHSPLNIYFCFYDYCEIEAPDTVRFNDPRRRFVACATNCNTGQAEYLERDSCSDIIAAIKASASLPYISPMVEVDDQPYLDGGCACKIPYQWALGQQFEKIVVVRTNHLEYRKKIGTSHPALTFYRHYPAFAESLDRSNAAYNAQCDELEQLATEGRICMVAPSTPVTIDRLEGDMEKLGALYWQGYVEGTEALDRVLTYLGY